MALGIINYAVSWGVNVWTIHELITVMYRVDFGMYEAKNGVLIEVC